MKTRYLIGTSGWQFKDWKKRFYPENISSKEWLKFYAKNFSTVEVNSAFYRIIKSEIYEKWRTQVGKRFIFVVKLNRYFTHVKRLIIDEESEGRLIYCLKQMATLADNLGPILIQLAPGFKQNAERLEYFLQFLEKVNKKKYKGKILFAIEFRHDSWLTREVFAILERHKAAYCITDSADWKTNLVKTVDWTYVRLHGKPELFSSLYADKDLKKWLKIIGSLKVKKAFIFFNNDDSAHAAKNASSLKKMV
ncbi:MAG: hypothetical protein UT48_C0016G0010 [Parcubacteria group bacterium GW2011_GWE2_39_37]|uniref:DUF72 domain-containing protein n=1 Tax=Candidatus Falkowbacteria bacterium GW2011_GWF2_39_8 TaxID=1618642 RepID=A0A0G0SCQ5_9BACT|nr:MAG: hypothetical protein UT48_C0016G0010 [Parcubacteria group bacterium GW2011_GWE2_39_37]KKR32525.1 MAG: hypothetical protein UT64_C0031G0010 [Candidatus Falkowbacteria bacterium GW2011_GWF2_39_8]